jgi:hypothetical protein
MWGEAVASVNEYVKKLAADNVDTGVTVAVFDSGPNGGIDFQVIRDRIIPKTMKLIDPTETPPRGSTPLNDATMRLIGLAEAGNYEKVAIIIMTDGEENCSREANVAVVKAALDRLRAKNWQIIFLGANFDNVRQSTAYGNSARNTIQASAVNLTATMGATAAMRGTYGLTGQAMNYSEDFKKAAKKDKPVA